MLSFMATLMSNFLFFDMKKFLFFIFIAMLSLPLAAQGGSTQVERQQRREQVKALKIAYFTEKVGLTSAESERFWPIYNQYWDERRQVAHRKRDILRKMESGAVLKADIGHLFDIQDSENALMRRYAEQFMTVLSAEKTAKLLAAEESFKFMLLKESGLSK